MNTYLNELTQFLVRRLGVTDKEVMDVLYMLRAHHNLAAMIPCCKRLSELMDLYPQIAENPAFPDQARRLNLVCRIAELKDADTHFYEGFIVRNNVSDTPLRPYTGDSSLCDLLVIREPPSQHTGHAGDVSWLKAWFTWHVLQHQARVHKRDVYERYITGETSGRLIAKEGTRIYGAFLALRELMGVQNAERAAAVAKELTAITPDDAERLAEMLTRAHAHVSLRNANRQRGLILAAGLDPDEDAEKLARLRVVDPAIARFLSLIWLSEAFTSKGARNHRSIVRSVRRVGVIRYSNITTIGQEVGADGQQSGFLLEIIKRQSVNKSSVPVPKDQKEDVLDDDLDDLDPGDGEAVEPEIMLFLGDGDPIRSWYASQSALHHIEHQNAMLPWPTWRLSVDAIIEVLRAVTLINGESPIDQRARLAIGLSLISGRSLEEVSGFAIGRDIGSIVTSGCTVWITRADHMLHVLAGRPLLKEEHSRSELCAPVCTTLRLPLPCAWRSLIDAVGDQAGRRSSRVTKHATALLAKFPQHWEITPRAVAGALKLAILNAGRDDLALLKVLTDAHDANLENLIHYASYERAEVERLWYQIVSSWAGSLADRPDPEKPGERVGNPQGFDPQKLATLISDLKRRCLAAMRDRHWAEAYNLLVVYLSLWIGMATAGRRVCQPVPGVITPDGWALVRDKSRPDGSTDRYLPLRKTLLEQLAVMQSVTSALSILQPEFVDPESDSGHLIALRYFRESALSVPYQPKYMALYEGFETLPGNWGRKFVRSASSELTGRFKDAGLGHWVRGRHPWSMTSTFPSQRFKSDWLALQERLEAELGFEVLDFETLHPKKGKANTQFLHTFALPVVATPVVEETRTKVAMSGDELDALLIKSAGKDLYSAAFNAAKPLPEATLGVARDALLHLAKKTTSNLPDHAEQICEHIRKKTKVPLFACRPRARFQKNWLVNRGELSCLAHLQAHLLPAIQMDFAALPAPGASQEDLRKDVGRLIAAAVLRGGMACSQHLNIFLAFVASDRPVQAVHDARLVELQVQSQRSRDAMRRTVLLEPYLAALVSVERSRLKPLLEAAFKVGPDKRRHRWNAALRCYLSSLGVPAEISLAQFMAAARQKIQLEASPVLSAYASGELLTDDLPVSEFRRLAGLLPRSGGKAAEEPGTIESVHGNSEDVETVMPKDLEERPVDFYREICGFKSSFIGEWVRRIRSQLQECRTTDRKLLCAFALYMVKEYQSQEKQTISWRERLLIGKYLKVVWHGIVGFSNQAESLVHLSEDVLQALCDLTIPHFPARTHHGAWPRFRTFLVNQVEDLTKLGITVGTIRDVVLRQVSAKILSAKERTQIAKILRSPQSGIGTPENRIAAGRHFAITAAAGTRRAESEKLRWVDCDGNLLRIREFEERTLKTPAAVRIIPLEFLGEHVRAQIDDSRAAETEKPIDACKGHRASGDNFFHQMSKAMKAVTGDPDIGPHHLRHTKASALTLSMLANTVDLTRLSVDLPWVADLLMPEEQLNSLLGTAGQSGQGLKAISVLLGHVHETTTLRHYIHTLCIALYAYHLSLPAINLERAFEKRSLSRPTRYRFSSLIKDAGLNSDQAAKKIRNRVESKAQKQSNVPLVSRDETPLQIGVVGALDPVAAGSAQKTLDDIETIEQHLLSGQSAPTADILAICQALKEIALIPSGKRGSCETRHLMPLKALDGTPMPTPLLQGVPIQHALHLIAWLQQLRADRLADYEWLLCKWLTASDRLEGAMRLKGKEEVSRVKSMPKNPWIQLEIRPTKSELRKSSRAAFQSQLQLRIKFPQGNGKRYRGRGSGAVRWVMTWFSAIDRLAI